MPVLMIYLAAPTEPDAWAVAGIALSVARAGQIHARER
jgi:hypothetical protein